MKYSNSVELIDYMGSDKLHSLAARIQNIILYFLIIFCIFAL